MKWFWGRLLLIPLGTLAWLVGATMIRPSLALAPALETEAMAPLPAFESLEALYELRDRLWLQVDDPKNAPFASENPLEALQAVEIRIHLEETAVELRNRSVRLASQAIELDKATNPSIDDAGTRYALWKEAVDLLHEIPSQSLIADSIPAKITQYQAHLDRASYAYDTARSGFLGEIAKATGLPAEDVRITVCHIEGECRRWQGNTPPASPASLIKLPIAIALMQKVTEETINLDTKMVVARGNYTEDASDIWAGAEYPLHKILMRMINQSSNIATNQLIDYVGRAYINQVMRDRGFSKTLVDYKMVGESTYPANAGSTPNRTTTDELTEMMRQIYRQEHPGDEVLIDALASQYDIVLGHDGLRGTDALWMGEKTGQNSKALGTTLAFQLSGELYFATVILDYSANERALRNAVKAIAKHIMEAGSL
jgi:beta-lactamase class A